MEQYVGLDVPQEQSSVCVVDGGGKVIWEGKCVSTPEAIAATIRTSKLSVILHRMLRDGNEFRWSAKEVHAA